MEKNTKYAIIAYFENGHNVIKATDCKPCHGVGADFIETALKEGVKNKVIKIEILINN